MAIDILLELKQNERTIFSCHKNIVDAQQLRRSPSAESADDAVRLYLFRGARDADEDGWTLLMGKVSSLQSMAISFEYEVAVGDKIERRKLSRTAPAEDRFTRFNFSTERRSTVRNPFYFTLQSNL